jgi:hypothetical protein
MESQLIRQSSIVADRQTVDIEGIRDRIVKVYEDNHLWDKLSMAQKLRQLIEEGLEAAELQRKASSKGGK